jgi:tetratricopeptide (TPR) repeat protein
MKGCVVILLNFLLLGVVQIAICEDDAVFSLIKEYEAASDDFRKIPNPTKESYTEWLKTWKQRFQKVIESNPKSPALENAKVKLLGLCNGLSDFDDSKQLLSGMIESQSVSEKICWLNELGEISRAEFAVSHSIEDAKAALDAFGKAQDLYLSLEESQKKVLGKRQIIALSMAGDLSANVPGEEANVPLLYSDARKIFQEYVNCGAEAVASGCDRETLLQEEMQGWIRCGNKEKATEILAELSKTTPLRWTPSYYALMYAEHIYAAEPQQYQRFLDDWSKRNPFDERMPILWARLAFSYYDTEQYIEALPIYELLRNKYIISFQKLEPLAFKDGRGGCCDRILSNLAVIYMRMGKLDEAEKVKDELRVLLPNSGYMKFRSNADIRVDLYDINSLPESRNRSFFMRILLITGGAAMISISLYSLFIKKR